MVMIPRTAKRADIEGTSEGQGGRAGREKTIAYWSDDTVADRERGERGTHRSRPQ